MDKLERQYEVTQKDLTKDRTMLLVAWSSPILAAILPALIFLIIGFFSGGAFPLFIFLALISLGVGFFLGLLISGISMIYRQRWLGKLREKISVDGIKSHEVRWFMHELTSGEKKSLKEVEAKNLLLGDAYRETLASRLTATQIIKSTKQELQLVKRRQYKLKGLKAENSQELKAELEKDLAKLEEINKEAKLMKDEAEARLLMIEAAASRGTNLVDHELNLKQLSSRTQELPLALEAVRMEEEIRQELEKNPLP